MFLVDTNVWLERLLDQERSEEVRRFLDATSSERLFISDFSFHSIGIIMIRLNKADEFLSFVRDAFIDGCVGLVLSNAIIPNGYNYFRITFLLSLALV